MFCALTQDKPRAETVLRHGVYYSVQIFVFILLTKMLKCDSLCLAKFNLSAADKPLGGKNGHKACS